MTTNTSRTMIAALQVSLDGFIQGPNGEKDWVELGNGKALFSGVNKRRSLDLVQAESTESGRVILTYRT